MEEEERSKRPAPSTHADELGGILYQPKTRETRQSYEVLLNFILHCIGDQVRACVCMCVRACVLVLSNIPPITGYVVIPQYWFLIPSNILNTVIP